MQRFPQITEAWQKAVICQFESTTDLLTHAMREVLVHNVQHEAAKT